MSLASVHRWTQHAIDEDAIVRYRDLQKRLVTLEFRVPDGVGQTHQVVPWKMATWNGVTACSVEYLRRGKSILTVTCLKYKTAAGIRQYCRQQGWTLITNQE